MASINKRFVLVAAKRSLFAGNVDAAFAFARNVCRQISGGCHATVLPGNVLTVVIGTDSAINRFGFRLCKANNP